jgi:hypothetical protein
LWSQLESESGSTPDHEPPDLAEITRIARVTAAAAGKNFSAVRDLAEAGIPTPNGEPVWTAVILDRLLNGQREER